MKYLNFEGLQYFYSKLSSSLASQYVSQSNLKTINGQSLIGTGDITIEGGASGDYLPLSGGALTGNLVMAEMGDILFMDHESKLIGGIQTESDHSPIASRGTYSTIYCNYSDDSSKSQLSPGGLSLTDRGEYIYVRPSGIEKTGGSPTKVFATDGSVVDMNTYLPLSGGTMTGALTVTSGGITLGRGEVVLSDQGGIKITGIVPQTGLDRTKAALYVDTQGSDHNALGISTTGKIFVDGAIDAGGQIQSSTGFYSTGTAYIESEITTDSIVTAQAFYESSDVSLKENIAPITKEATDAVDCLTFKQFNFKDDKDKTTKYGVIAQEVEAVGLGNLVKDNGEAKSVDYISLLILKIEALEKRITELEAERR